MLCIIKVRTTNTHRTLIITYTFVSCAETREKNENFGSSLLLANSPMSPKIVNGSFAAIFDNSDVLMEFARKFSQLRVDMKDSPGINIIIDFNFFFFYL
jgi:hypothetical protein